MIHVSLYRDEAYIIGDCIAIMKSGRVKNNRSSITVHLEMVRIIITM